MRLNIAGIKTKCHELALTGKSCPQAAVVILRRKHGNAIGWQSADDLTIFKCDSFHGGHVLLVLSLRIVDQADSGLCKARQYFNLARMVHA